MEKTICEKCGKWAIKQSTGIVLTSYPPQYPMMWKCGCGWSTSAGTIRGTTEEEVFNKQWEEANK